MLSVRCLRRIAIPNLIVTGFVGLNKVAMDKAINNCLGYNLKQSMEYTEALLSNGSVIFENVPVEMVGKFSELLLLANAHVKVV